MLLTTVRTRDQAGTKSGSGEGSELRGRIDARRSQNQVIKGPRSKAGRYENKLGQVQPEDDLAKSATSAELELKRAVAD